MKKSLSILALALIGTASALGSEMPAESLMASGKWTKIRIHSDGVYQMTFDQLRSLGYENPERVKVYGYSPTLLLSCSFNTIPGDVEQVYTHVLNDEQKIVFYLSDNYNCSPEIWRTSDLIANDAKSRQRHVFSQGATYFLSDVDNPAPSLAIQSVPDLSEDDTTPLNFHHAVIYHESDNSCVGEGGAIFTEDPLITPDNGPTYTFTVDNLASENARIFMGSYLAATSKDDATTLTDNRIQTIFSEGITLGQNVCSKLSAPSSKETRVPSFQTQELTLPLTTAETTHSVSFRLGQKARYTAPAALDFYAIMYERTNNVGVRPQTMMYFKNYAEEAVFELQGIDPQNWLVWNVTNPAKITSIVLKTDGDNAFGHLPAAQTNRPNEVIAFNVAADQPSPEIIGSVDNQNLHAMEVPQMLIITSTPLLAVAENVADIHRNRQGLNVAVIDQMEIFNEYGSGNVSPEAVRRFITHLSQRQPNRLQGVLMLGPGTFNNHKLVGPGSNFVVTYQTEEPEMARNLTLCFTSDLYFVATGESSTDGAWLQRTPGLRVFSNPLTIGIGRVPFNSEDQINDYYRKVDQYLSQPPTTPTIGNILAGSDLSKSNEATRTHFNDNEIIIARIDSARRGTDITITRCPSNFYSQFNNTVLKATMDQALKRGVNLYTFFGHGSPLGISGSTNTVDPVFNLLLANNSNYPTKAPFMFIASCSVGSFDIHNKTLANSLIANPFGGAIAILSSAREVYPAQNTTLGELFISRFDQADNETPIGQIWATAAADHISAENFIKKFGNTLDYNLLGDPMLPVYTATHSVEINPITELSTTAPSTISGCIKKPGGAVDTQFSGTVLLTFYEAPTVVKNKLTLDSNVKNDGWKTELTFDHDVLGQISAPVTNGRFEIQAKAPLFYTANNHRIQAYAFSADATQRALGSICGVNFTNDGASETTAAEPIKISSLNAEIPALSTHGAKVAICATFSAPAGLTVATLSTPALLKIDSQTISNASALIKNLGNNEYILDCTSAPLAFGSHTIELTVVDAQGNMDSRSMSLFVDNTPAAKLSVAVADRKVCFELSSPISAAVHRLVIERLNGEVALDQTFSGYSHTVELSPGVYRAYVQVSSLSAAAATQKIIFVVD